MDDQLALNRHDGMTGYLSVSGVPVLPVLIILSRALG